MEKTAQRATQNLMQFGFNSYEAKAYEALIKEGTSTAFTVAKKSGVPFGKIYPVLEALAAKKCIVIHHGQPKQYAPYAPEVVLKERIEQQRRVGELQHAAKKLISSLTSLAKHERDKPEDIVEVYYGHAAAFARSIVLHKQAKAYWKTISALTVNKEHLDACSEAIKRGVELKALTSLQETNKERIAEWKKREIQVRLLDSLHFRVSIYDDRGVILRFSHEKSKQYVGVHIINQKLAKGMHQLFEELWGKAEKS